ncbi:hypothetical protein DPMN_182630 [Dreissena polymorpha]|uniref:Uncharacterized protein n=1 Tax=Dreissena polymorpha TaxID=45954 RepID=A0A9D4DHI3_DREPO|nr:hypothetical protein DPMN_182630 [Dreissena polymorpha]
MQKNKVLLGQMSRVVGLADLSTLFHVTSYRHCFYMLSIKKQILKTVQIETRVPRSEMTALKPDF